MTSLLLSAILPFVVTTSVALPSTSPPDGLSDPLQEAPRYEGHLSVVPVDFSSVGSTSGSGRVEAWIEDGTLRVEGSFEGTPTPAASAELRRGPPGIPGPVVAELDVEPDTAGAILGRVEADDGLTQALRDGHLYVLVRTEGNPEGEIRGWIVPPEFPGGATASRETADRGGRS